MSDTYAREDDIRRIQEAIVAGDQMNGWRQIYAEIDQWIRGRDYFFGYDDALFGVIGLQSGHRALSQESARGGYVRLYQMSKGETIADIEQDGRADRLTATNDAVSFLATCRRMGLDMSHPVYGMAGYEHAEDLFYIDGIPAKEYVEKLYPGQNLTAGEDSRKLLRAEIVSAVLSGEHHVEAAKLGISQNGDYEIGVVEVRLDDKLLDGQERFYQTKPSRKAEKLYSSDKTGRERRDAIRGKVSERFAAAAAKRINETEYQKHPHAAAAKKFSQDKGELAYDYFDDLALGQLNWISVDSFLTRQSFDILKDFREDRKPFGNNFTAGNFKGFRVLAQLKLLADHPEIRVADLMDPAKYIDEKKEAGGLVSEACVSYFMGPQETDLNDRVYMEPLAEIVGSAMKAISNMDVRKELLYALGEPMNLEGDQAISVMEKPENLLYVNSFLSSLNDRSGEGGQLSSGVC